MPTPFRVRVFRDEKLVSEQTFEDTLVKIGKHATANLRLDERTAAAIHAVLTCEDDAIFLTDVSGARGTLVNGKPVGKRLLAPGDEIRIASLRLLVDRPTIATEPPPLSLVTAPVPPPAAVETAAPPAPRPEPVPAPSAPTPPRDSSRLKTPALQLACYWGDRLLQVSQHAQPETVLMGQSHRCALRVGGEERMLVEPLDGGFALHVDSGVKAKRQRGEKIDELGSGLHALEVGDFAWVEMGGLRVEASFAKKPRKVKVPFGNLVDLQLVNLILVLTFLAGLFAVSAQMRDDSNTIADDFENGHLVSIVTRFPISPIRQPDRRTDATNTGLSNPEPLAMTPAHAGEEGQAGNPKQPRHKKFTGGVGRIDGRSLLSKTGFLTELGAGGGVFTPGVEGLGKAMDSIKGPTVGEVGDGFGFGGMGRVGMGPGGGGDSWRSVGIGSVFRPGLRTGTGVGPNLKRDGGPKPVPHFFEEPPVTEGALDPELVRKVIHSHVSQIRFCYEQELSHKPDLAGRVRVRFTVNGAGDVPAASIAEGTNISDPELRACILSRVRGWQFPAPKGGGSAIVTYPFLLQPSGE